MSADVRVAVWLVGAVALVAVLLGVNPWLVLAAVPLFAVVGLAGRLMLASVVVALMSMRDRRRRR